MRFVLKRLNLFLILSILFSGVLFSQNQDISLESIGIDGGEPLCPTNSANVTFVIKNNGPVGNNNIQSDIIYFQVNGPIPRAPAQYRVNVVADIAVGASRTLTWPTDFTAVGGASMTPLDLSDPNGPYTITASITIPNDPVLSNNTSTSLQIGVHSPTTYVLQSNDADNSIFTNSRTNLIINYTADYETKTS